MPLRRRDRCPCRPAPLLHQDVPWLKSCDQSRFRLGMLLEIVIQAGGEGVAQRAKARRAALVILLGTFLAFVGAHQEIARDSTQPVDFGRSPDDPNEIRFQLPEIVLGLRVHQAEDHTGVRLRIDMGNTIMIAIDRHRPGQVAGRVAVPAENAGARDSMAANRKRVTGQFDHPAAAAARSQID